MVDREVLGEAEQVGWVSVLHGYKDIWKSGAAVKIALKIKDSSQYEAAALEQLKAQSEFAAHYAGLFGPERMQGPRGQYCPSGEITADDYCNQFGFSDRNVRRLVKREYQRKNRGVVEGVGDGAREK